VLFLDEPTVGLDQSHATPYGSICGSSQNYDTTLFLTPITWRRQRATATASRSCTWQSGGNRTCKELETSLGSGAHTLDEVFTHYAGTDLDSGGTFHSISTTALRPSALDDLIP